MLHYFISCKDTNKYSLNSYWVPKTDKRNKFYTSPAWWTNEFVVLNHGWVDTHWNIGEQTSTLLKGPTIPSDLMEAVSWCPDLSISILVTTLPSRTMWSWEVAESSSGQKLSWVLPCTASLLLDSTNGLLPLS